jgi:tRNA(Ile)-lysidine synthase
LGGRSLKLSDYFINVKLLRRARELWPLVISGGGSPGEEIAWVPGFRLAHPFRLTPLSRQAIHFALIRASGE